RATGILRQPAGLRQRLKQSRRRSLESQGARVTHLAHEADDNRLHVVDVDRHMRLLNELGDACLDLPSEDGWMLPGCYYLSHERQRDAPVRADFGVSGKCVLSVDLYRHAVADSDDVFARSLIPFGSWQIVI